jgi:hypothetical protein
MAPERSGASLDLVLSPCPSSPTARPARSRRPDRLAERRRALELLASSRHGANEDLLIRGHGFSRGVLASLVRRGLATAERETMKAGRKTIEVGFRITDAGRRAIEE